MTKGVSKIKTTIKEKKYSVPPEIITMKNSDGSLLILNGQNDKYFFKLHGSMAIHSFEWFCEGKTVSWILKKLEKSAKPNQISAISKSLNKLLSGLIKNNVLVEE